MMRRQIRTIFLAGILSLSSLAATTPEPKYLSAPAQINGVSRIMKTAGYWIGRHPEPDRLIMDPATVGSFNERLRNSELNVYDLRRLPNPYNGNTIRQMIEQQVDALQNQELYDQEGKKVSEKFFKKVRARMDLINVLEQKDLEFGFVTRFADQRMLPTRDGLYAKINDIEFDEVQNSGLDVGTPILILHESKDKKWIYVLSEISSGWVEEDRVARSSASEFQSFLGALSFAVITEPKADIYLDPQMKTFHDHARMGMKFPLLKDDDEQRYMIMLPKRTEKGKMESVIAYVPKAQASAGFLPYTARTIFEQAFKLLNEPYGWGDMQGEQDCSRFLQEVFGTVGIILPRDSKNQAKAGHLIAGFEDKSAGKKIAALEKIPGGGIILTMKGHIMLYLGMIDEKPYAIHSVWAYRQPDKTDGDIVRVLNRVTLSDLLLGQGSQKGSLLQRMNGIVEVKK